MTSEEWLSRVRWTGGATYRVGPGPPTAAAQIDGAFFVRTRPEVVGVEVNGEAVLLLERTRNLHTPSGVGTIVWGMHDGRGGHVRGQGKSRRVT